MTLAASERSALADLLLEVGPAAPTLCAGWDAYDLAAHLWVREHRPWLVLLAQVPALARQDPIRAVRDEFGYAELVRGWRRGPGRLSPFGLPGVDVMANTAEHFIHHEDVRRAGDSPRPPRVLPDEAERELRVALARMSRLLLARSPVRVHLIDDHGTTWVRGRPGATTVRVRGPVGELMLFSSGRRAVARVEVDGPESAVRGLEDSLGM